MMKTFLLILVLNFMCLNLLADVKIEVTINDEIITNYDIEKESNYLKILNPQLNLLNDEKVFDFAKKSLINEIIKKKEIEKFINIKQDNLPVKDFLENLYMRLKYESLNSFKNDLKTKETYNISDIENKIKLDLFWKDLIFNKFQNQINIDTDKLKKKLENLEKKQTELFLSEIVFGKQKDFTLEDTINNIKESIKEIGFDNTANLYGISNSSKFGGEIGWVKKNSLSSEIIENLDLISLGEITNPIKIGNNFMILKLEQIRENEIKIDLDKELEKLIQIEKNNQFNQFSQIYFNKLKVNYLISEK